jgi:two-component system nitrogen regulation sensor histidine kinase GlnL
LPVPVLGIDAANGIAFANVAARELFSGLNGVSVGKALAEVVGAASPILALVERVRREASVVEMEAHLPGAGPKTTVIATPVGEQGHVAMTIRRAPAARGDEPSRTRAIRTFSHEVRNPLAGIRAAAQLIGRDANPEHQALVSLICEEVDRLRRLTERFDPLAGDSALNMRALNVHEPLSHVRKVIASMAPDLRFLELYDPSLPAIRGDFDQLVQAFLNIAKNAVEVMGRQPDAKLTVTTTYRTGVHLRTAQTSAARALLEVSFVDNGPGIPPEIGGRIFEAFVTTKEAGMGLGLSIASAIIARHGGTIEVQSEPGRTEFKMSLPIDQERKE